jgi:hypothetical protein
MSEDRQPSKIVLSRHYNSKGSFLYEGPAVLKDDELLSVLQPLSRISLTCEKVIQALFVEFKNEPTRIGYLEKRLSGVKLDGWILRTSINPVWIRQGIHLRLVQGLLYPRSDPEQLRELQVWRVSCSPTKVI